MAAKYSRHIALTGPLASYVDSQVVDGNYASASEIVRAALRLLIEHDKALSMPRLTIEPLANEKI
jgi:antitoxin ParD1/3/4